MTADQQASFEHLRQLKKQYSAEHMDYWLHYSIPTTWEFWTCVVLLIGPLVLLYYMLDRSKAFHMGFFGYSIHIVTFYTDNLGVTRGLWDYPYKVLPFLPMSLMIDASLVPVFYMLVYQWTVHRHKSKLLYLTATSAIFAFVIKPLLSLAGLFMLYEWMNFFYLFLAYLFVMFGAMLLTAIFRWLMRSVIHRTA
ncbi:CBO0543 family protein [Paenibacillus sp. S-38]|uniref:CBO0543 family protein n=1 Tax=Paenibacillus sp. S-38 TaxID=3416710 RepID=UPI003CF74685